MNRKGYTMIELITVIIVLAAIAIVVMPIMTGVIDTARKSAAQQSAYNYIREVNSTILQNKSGPNRMSDRTYTLEELTKYGVTVSGTMPSEGNVTVIDEKVSSYYLVVNGYTFTMGEVKKDTTAPTITDITPHDADMTDWVTSIEIAVAAHDDENGVGLQINAYSFDGGATWQESNKKTVFENGTYKIEVRDNAGNIATQDKIIAKISSSTPSITIKGSAEGSNYVTVSATVANSQVGIAKMEYTIDEGATWIADGKNTIHTFGGLKKQTQYNVKARVTSANGKTATSDSLTLSTVDILTPTYSISSGDWTQSKSLTITYPTIAEQTMIYSYSLDDGNTWKTASQIQGVTFTANGTIIAMVTDSTNTVYASSYTVNKIDTTAPVISGINGNSSTWTTSVTLSVIAADENGGSGLQANAYSFDGGAIWQSSNSKTFTANGTYQIAVRDNAGNISTNQVVVNKISTKAPTISLATNTVGSSDVVVTTTITTSEMGVDKIEYSSDNGATWTADGTNTTHTYGGLTKLTKYTLRAKITDKNGQYAFSPQVDVTTKDVSAPTYAIDKTGWSQSKVVTITYPTMTGQTYLYSYSTDEGATWKPATQVQNVTFTTNGTIIAQVTDSGSNTVTGTTYTVSDVDSLAPAIASVTGDPLEWTTTTNIVINATDELGGSGLQTEPYSFDGGTTWQASNTKTVTANGTFIIKVRDNVNNIASSQINITKISTTAPTITLAKSQVGSNFVITQASVVDNEMGAQKIEYSSDNGTTWVTSDTSVNHTFGGLKANTSYTLLARVTSNNGKTATSNALTVTTTDITAPTYGISSTDWADSKIVTITYPTIVGETLTYTYSLDEGTTWLAATQVQQVTFTANGTIIARVTDTTNTITANTYAVDKIYPTDIGIAADDLILSSGSNVYTYLGGTYIKGSQTNNYIWFSGFVWRIMGKDKDGNVKMISEEGITNIPLCAVNTAQDYDNSYAKKWVSQYFISHLKDTSILKPTYYCKNGTVTDSTSSLVNCATGAQDTSQAALLSLDEYNLSGGTSSYLNSGEYFWTLTPASSNNLWEISSDGTITNNSVSLPDGQAIRPIITIAPETKITSGDCSLSSTSNGCILNQTLDNVVNKKISEVASSGEYVKYDGHTYRVVEKNNDGVKLITDEYYKEYKNAVNAYATLKSWLLPTKTALSVVWYEGDKFNGNYEDTLNSTSNPVTTDIGRIRVGEMLSSASLSILTNNYSILDAASRYNQDQAYWTYTRYNKVCTLSSGFLTCFLDSYTETNESGVTSYYYIYRPVIVISSDSIISTGNGTLTAPFQVN